MSGKAKIAEPKSKAHSAAAHANTSKGGMEQAAKSSLSFLSGMDSVQAKLSVGSPDDKFEKEADQTAEAVMRMPQPEPIVQRKEESTEEIKESDESAKIQRKAIEHTSKQDAQPSTESNGESLRKSGSGLSVIKPSVVAPRVLRKEEDEELQKKENGTAGRGPPVAGQFASKLNQSKGGGQPMDSSTLGFMNSRFGTDFSGVRIHTGSDASSMSDSIQAKAFTHRNDIYFNSGQYQPETREGKTLLAHELTHTIQQGAVSNTVQPKLKVNAPDDTYEKEADATADRIMRKPQEEEVQRKCTSCEKEESIQRSALSDRGPPAVQRKCAACQKEDQSAATSVKEDEVQRKCAACEREENIQRKCKKCEEEEHVQRKTRSISQTTPRIQRYSWSEFVDDVSGVASAVYDTVSDAVSTAYNAAVNALSSAYESIKSLAGQAWGAISGAAEWLWDQAGRAANWAWERVTELAGWLVEKFKQAWEFAKWVAEVISGYITFENGILRVEGPSLTVCPQMMMIIESENFSQYFPLAGLHWIGDHIEFLGDVGIQATFTSQLELLLGPCQLNNSFFEIDILGLSTSVGADLSVDIGATIRGQYHAGGYAEGTANLFFPPGSTTPININDVLVEAGAAGEAVGTIAANHNFQFRSTVGLFHGISMSVRDNAFYGISADLGVGAYGSLAVGGQNLCRLYYPFWESHFEAATNVDWTIGLSYGAGFPTVMPSASINNISGVPFNQTPQAFDRSVLQADCPLCDRFNAMGIMPRQVGVVWDGHPEPAWGGPLFAYPKAPNIASGALCRGACGPDCHEDACTVPEDKYVCEEMGDGHIWHVYPAYTDCNSHPACRQHDHCYDWCAEGGENSILGPCHRWCDLECACENNAPSCIDWAMGGGRSDRTMPFSDPPFSFEGCRGGCPENIADEDAEPQYQLCLPDFELMGRQDYDYHWDDSTGEVEVFQTFVEVPYIVGVWLGVDAEATIDIDVNAGLGPITLSNVCLDVDPTTGTYEGSAKLSAVADITPEVTLTGILHAWGSDFLCLLEWVRMSGELALNAGATLQETLSYDVNIECVDGEIRLSHGLNLESCLKLFCGLDAAFELFILGFSVYENNWDLADWEWEKCWDYVFELPPFGENELPSGEFMMRAFDAINLLQSIFPAASQGENDVRVSDGRVDRRARRRGILNPCGGGGGGGTPEAVEQDPVTAETAHDLESIRSQLNVTRYTTDTITLPGGHSNTVGIGMETQYLTNHPDKIREGSDSTGSAQRNIYGFRKIPQRGAFGRGGGYTQDMVFIKGHLLNGNTGGPAEDRNLYPITGLANDCHKCGPERWVKTNVLDNEYLVYYEVAVENRTSPQLIDVYGDGTCTYYQLDCDYTCFYSTYKLYDSGRLERNRVTRVPVESRFNEPDFITLVTNRGCPQRKSSDGSGSSAFFERQADSIADHVVNGSGGGSLVNQVTPLNVGGKSTQRKCAACEKEEQVQRKAWEKDGYNPYLEEEIQRSSDDGGGGFTAGNGFSSGLQASKGGGQPMDSGTQSFMENSFGTDFSNVRIHSDNRAANLSDQIQAKAFTHGNDIYFNQGQYNPETKAGKHLLAHELTHTVQQGASGDVQRKCTKCQEEDRVQRMPMLPTPMLPLAKPSSEPEDKANDPNCIAVPAKQKGEPETYVCKPMETIDLISGTATPSEAMLTWLKKKGRKGDTIDVKFGKYAKGQMMLRSHDGKTITTVGKGHHAILANISYLNPLKKIGIDPALAIQVKKNAVSGYLAATQGGEIMGGKGSIFEWMRKNATKFGWDGIEVMSGQVNNAIEAGGFRMEVTGIPVRVGGFLDGQVEKFGMFNDRFSFAISANVNVPLLTPTSLNIERSENGELSGGVKTGFTISRLSGEVDVKYKKGLVDITGTIGYHDEHFDGNLTIMLTDYESAMNLAFSRLDPEKIAAMSEVISSSNKPGGRALAGHGTLDFELNEHFKGKVEVIVDGEGYITVIGKWAPDTRVALFDGLKPEKPYEKPLFAKDFEYGIPYLASFGIGVKIDLFATWGVNPAYLHNLHISGVYSTNPRLQNNRWTIGANLNISAFAEAGIKVFIFGFAKLLGHSVQVGLNMIAAAGIKGYLDSGIELGLRPSKKKKGESEYFISGKVVMAAQPYIRLGSEFAVALDSPWWSPVPDKTWSWPLGELFFPIAGSLGIQMDIDHAIGSGEWPTVDFKPHSFDPEHFMEAITEDQDSLKANNGDKEMNSEFMDKTHKNDKKKGGREKGKANRKKRLDDRPSKQELEGYKNAVETAKKYGGKVFHIIMTSKQANQRLRHLRSMPFVKEVKSFKQSGMNHLVYIATERTNNRQMKEPVYWSIIDDGGLESQDEAELTAKEVQQRVAKLREIEGLYLKENQRTNPGYMFEEQTRFVKNTFESRHKNFQVSVVRNKGRWEYHVLPVKLVFNKKTFMIDRVPQTHLKQVIIGGKILTWEGVIESSKVNASFTDAVGEQHKLFYDHKGRRADMQMASNNPGDIEPKLEKELGGSSAGTPKEKAMLKQALKQTRSIEKKINENMTGAEPQDSRTSQAVVNLAKDGTTIVANLAASGGYGDEGKPLPKTTVSFGGLSRGGFGASMFANPLTREGEEGSIPTVENAQWNAIKRRTTKSGGGRTWYARGHLLNHNIHGTGKSWSNLTPITQTSNGEHLRKVESDVKKYVDQGKILKYRVNADVLVGKNSALESSIQKSKDSWTDKKVKLAIARAERFVPARFSCTVTVYDNVTDYEQGKSNTKLSFAMPITTYTRTTEASEIFLSSGTTADSAATSVDFNRSSVQDLQYLPGIGSVTAQLIVELRPFRDFDDMLSKLLEKNAKIRLSIAEIRKSSITTTFG